jgi:hypothetical protein
MVQVAVVACPYCICEFKTAMLKQAHAHEGSCLITRQSEALSNTSLCACLSLCNIIPTAATQPFCSTENLVGVLESVEEFTTAHLDVLDPVQGLDIACSSSCTAVSCILRMYA